MANAAKRITVAIQCRNKEKARARADRVAFNERSLGAMIDWAQWQRAIMRIDDKGFDGPPARA